LFIVNSYSSISIKERERERNDIEENVFVLTTDIFFIQNKFER